MKYLFFIFLTLNAHASQILADLQSRLESQVSNHHHVGIILGIIEDNKKSFFSWGSVSLKFPKVPDLHDTFEIGSNTKVFTSLLLAELMEEGKVKDQDTLDSFFPELKNLDAGSITLFQLRTHTSGLPRLPDNLKPRDLSDPYKDYSETLAIEALKKWKRPNLVSQVYSNFGVGVLGLACKRILHLNFEEALKIKILDPLSLTNTWLRNEPQNLNWAQGYTSLLDEQKPWELNSLEAAGQIRSTAEDMLNFLSLELNPEKSSLKKILERTQHIDQINLQTKMGMGWFVDGDFFWHNGETGGFHSMLAFNLKQKFGIVVLSNTAESTNCVLSVLTGKTCNPPSYFEPSEGELKSIKGNYLLKEKTCLRIDYKKNKYLIPFTQIQGQQAFRMDALKSLKYSVLNGLATLEFHVVHNKADKILFTQEGRSQELKRTNKFCKWD